MRRPSATLRALSLAAALLSVADLEAQQVIRYPAASTKDSAGAAASGSSAMATRASLKDRWDWAQSEARKRDLDNGYWVAYTIERLMGERSFIGSWQSDPERNRPTLREVLAGMRLEFDSWDSPHSDDDDEGDDDDGDDGKKPEKMVKKEVAIVHHFGGGPSKGLTETEVSSMSLRVDLEGDPLIWIGPADQDESLRLLTGLFDDAGKDAKEHILMAVGMHGSDEAFAFLKKILLSDAGTDLRETAAFWLGQTGSDEALRTLKDVATNDPSEDIREKCVFSINQIGTDAAADALIMIARTHSSKETRKTAMFWLGQLSSKKSVKALSEMAVEDEDYEVQKSAVFALTQTEGNGGVDELISIATTHPDSRVRKDAIFWLSQSEDPRALEALVSIIKK